MGYNQGEVIPTRMRAIMAGMGSALGVVLLYAVVVTSILVATPHAQAASPTPIPTALGMPTSLSRLVNTISGGRAWVAEDLLTGVVTVHYVIDVQPSQSWEVEAIQEACLQIQQAIWMQWNGHPSEVVVDVVHVDSGGHPYLAGDCLLLAATAKGISWSQDPTIAWREYDVVAIVPDGGR